MKPLNDKQVEVLVEHEKRWGEIDLHRLHDEAKEPSHPWHHLLEWDDSRAARSYRLKQIRTYISRYRVTVQHAGSAYQVPRWVQNLEPGKIQSRVSAASVAAKPSTAKRQVMSEMQRARNALLRAKQVAIGVDAVSTFDEQVELLLEEFTAVAAEAAAE